MATPPPGFRRPKPEPSTDGDVASSADLLHGSSGSMAGHALASNGAGDAGRQGGVLVKSEGNALTVDSGDGSTEREKDTRVPKPVEVPREASPVVVSTQNEPVRVSAGEITGAHGTNSERVCSMDPRPPFFNAHTNQWYNSQPLPPYGYHSFSQPPPHYVNPSFPIQHNPQHPPIPFNLQPFDGLSQFPAHQPFQPSNLEANTVQRRERNLNWRKEEDEALCKAWLRVAEDEATYSDQPRPKLWNRILVEFSDLLGCPTTRLATGLMHRWSTIHGAMKKYSSCMQMIKGSNHENFLDAADQLYYDSYGHQFKSYSCLLILKDSTKWIMYTKAQEEKLKKHQTTKRSNSGVDVEETSNLSSPSTPTPVTTLGSVSPGSVNLNDTKDREEKERGHRSRKRCNYGVDGKGIPHSSHPGLIGLDDSRCSEPVLPLLAHTPGRKAAKGSRGKMSKKSKIGGQLANLIMEGFNTISRQTAAIVEKDQLERRRVRAEDRRWKQMKLDAKIMMMDPDSIRTEAGRAWLISEQAAILARTKSRGDGDGPSGSSN